jgi:hypothetical protein
MNFITTTSTLYPHPQFSSTPNRYWSLRQARAVPGGPSPFGEGWDEVLFISEPNPERSVATGDAICSVAGYKIFPQNPINPPNRGSSVFRHHLIQI